MDVVNEIRPLEVNGTEHKVGDKDVLLVKSHWNYGDRVVLVLGKVTLTVSAEELRKAIANATNHR